MKIQPIQTALAPQGTGEPSTPKTGALEKVSKEFETVLLKQFLTSAHVMGARKGAYGDIALDALAKGISDGGGLGVASALTKATKTTLKVPT